MNRKQQLAAYTVAGLALGLVIAGIALYTVSNTGVGMERVRRYAIGWLTSRVDGTVRIGSFGGNGLLRGVTLRDFAIIDRRGRPFLRTDSLTIAYNWRTLVSGEIVIERATIYNPQIWFEQLPGDTMWNFQHVFPDRNRPGLPQPPRRLILLHDVRIVNGAATVRLPFQKPADARGELREVIDTVPGGIAKVMRFDSVFGDLSRVVWESPAEVGRLIDIHTLKGRGFVWHDPMHVVGMRGTVTLRDSIVTFDVPEARLPSSRASLVGRVIMERGLNFFDVRVDSRSFVFRDLKWLYPRLPMDGGGSGVLHIQSQRPKGILWLATNARIAAPGTRVAGSFGVVTGADSLYFTNVDLRASPLNLELVQAMLPQKLPIQGLLVGTVEIKGGLSSLDTKGDVTLSNAGGTSGMKWRGNIDVRHGLGARDIRADVRQFDLALVNAVRPDLNLRGRVTGHVEASGHVQRTVKFAADFEHILSGYTSSFQGAGTYTGGPTPGLDIDLNARPLSLAELAQYYPALERLRGEARGPIRLAGALNDLSVKADLQTLGGRAQVEGRLTRAGERPRYSGDATLYTFRLDRLIDALPEMLLNGTIAFDVSGAALADATGSISATLPEGRIKGVDFREGESALKLEHGTARFDSLSARTFWGRLAATGSIGLTAQRSGTIAFRLRTDSIAPLADSGASRTAGRVRGQGTIVGSMQSFDLNANVDVTKLRLAALEGDRVSAVVKGIALGTDAGRVEVHGHADSLVAFGEQADTAAFALTYAAGRGDARIEGSSHNGYAYVADGSFEARPNGMLFTIRELRVGDRRNAWTLAQEGTVLAGDHGLTAQPIEIRRANGGSIRAEGRIVWHDATHAPELGPNSDFRLDFAGVPFAGFALVTLGTADVKGTLDGHVRVSGSATAPVLDSDVTLNAFQFADAALDHITGSFTYADQRLNARVDAEKDGRRVLFADGAIPANLAFLPVKKRKLAEPLRFLIQADSLPVSFVTALVGGFQDVHGRMDGTLHASGTTVQPRMSGSLALRNGAGAWDVTGVRYNGVEGTIRIEADRLAHVDATLKAGGGSGHVTGTMDFKRPADPGFALLGNAQNFLAAKRRDAEFTASGNVQLLGRYRQPIVKGAISVDHGALFLDELYRRYQIVELDNPLLFDVVDTSIVSLRTILARSQSPFIRNLTVQDLGVNSGREAWLRSRDLNVEVWGDLTISFLLPDTLVKGPRTAQDLKLTGSLRAVRGTYQLQGPGIARQFKLSEGTIEFPGTPGVDPNLAFNAVYRARSQRREPIDIIAVVGGTLRTPSVRLTSDEEPPISQSDLASYLFFGAPTYELSQSQSAAVSQATAGLTSSGFGYLASGLQNIAQSYGLVDYVALTATEAATSPGLTVDRGIGYLFAGTQLEVGRYFGENVYVAYSQRLTSTGWKTPGVRVEWRFVQNLTGEFFAEDRFARNPDFGIQNTTSLRNYGFFLYREWGY